MCNSKLNKNCGWETSPVSSFPTNTLPAVFTTRLWVPVPFLFRGRWYCLLVKMLSFIKESCFLSWCTWLEQLFHIKTLSSLCTVDVCLFWGYQFSTFIQTQVCSTLVTCVLAVGCPFVLSVCLKSYIHQCCGLWQNYCNSNWKIKGFQTLSNLYFYGKGNYYVILIMPNAGMF